MSGENEEDGSKQGVGIVSFDTIRRWRITQGAHNDLRIAYAELAYTELDEVSKHL